VSGGGMGLSNVEGLFAIVAWVNSHCMSSFTCRKLAQCSVIEGCAMITMSQLEEIVVANSRTDSRIKRFARLR
jgi:hypothetical protein